MKLCPSIVFCLALLVAPSARSIGQESKSAGQAWERSVVTIEVTRKQYDYLRPWSKGTHTTQKTGLVIGPKEVLVSAEDLEDRTLVRLQKGGRGKWFNAKVTWLDYHANLGLVTCEEAGFWSDLKPALLADPINTKQPMQIVRWRNGNMESRRVEFNQFTVDDAKLSFIQHFMLEVSSEINGVGWGEPIVAGGKVLGLTVSHNANTCRVLPAPLIARILQAQKKNEYRGLGYFDFVWQSAQNTASLRYLKLQGEPRGVIITEVPPHKDGSVSPLKPNDLILQIDGFEVDNEGYYHDPQYGHLLIENLSSRRHWAGDKIKIKVLREGQPLDIQFELPKVEFAAQLVPANIFDQEPEYAIVGGLIFQPLSRPFLKSWGADWKRNAPFRLTYYDSDHPTKTRPSVIVLSTVLPDPLNLGYQDYRYLVVDTVNGKKIGKLADILEALKEPKDGFHELQFTKGDSLQRIVLDAAGLQASTDRVLQRYRIPKPFVIAN